MADDAGDKTEAPTPRRRAEAREQGNIARSPDITAAALLLGVIVMLDWYGPGLIGALRDLMAYMLGDVSLRDRRPAIAALETARALRIVGAAMAPLLIGAIIVAVASNLVQVGFFFNFKRIQPQLSALNPFKGINRVIPNRDNLIHLAANLAKLCVITLVAYSAIRGKLPLILGSQNLSFLQIFSLGAAVVYTIAIRIGVLLLLLAILDYAYQRWSTEQKLKMSKQEIKDEMKRMDGDPRLKQRRRQIALQRLRQGIRQNVPHADVVVTNPTHFAVALKYDADTMHAPRVVAKGGDQLAQMIRELAIESGVPILERPPLARALYKLVDVGHEIPEQFYSAVAEILAYVYELSGKLKDKRQPVAT